jgi:hypothetical protein
MDEVADPAGVETHVLTLDQVADNVGRYMWKLLTQPALDISKRQAVPLRSPESFADYA